MLYHIMSLYLWELLNLYVIIYFRITVFLYETKKILRLRREAADISQKEVKKHERHVLQQIWQW